MGDVDVNYLAVFLAGVSSMVVGSIWYARGVFGNTWAKLAKVNMDRKLSGGQMAYMMGGTLLVSLLTAYVLANVVAITSSVSGNSFLEDSLMTAFWLWLGFTAARFFTHDAFEGRRKKLTALNLGNELVTVMAMALVIGLMGV